MDIIEKNLDEINELLLHAEQNIQNSRNVFAQIRPRLTVIEGNYNKIAGNYAELQDAHNRIANLNADELTRRNQELADLTKRINDLNTEFNNLDQKLNEKKNNNNEFIKNTVSQNIQGLIQLFNCFKTQLDTFNTSLGINNQAKQTTIQKITNQKTVFAKQVSEIRDRRKKFFDLENKRNEFFNDQLEYIKEFENILNEQKNLVTGRDEELINQQEQLNDAFDNHAENIKEQIEGQFNNLDTKVKSLNNKNNQIDNKLNNLNLTIQESNNKIQELRNNVLNGGILRFNKNFLVHFLLIFLTGYVLYLSIFSFIGFLDDEF